MGIFLLDYNWDGTTYRLSGDNLTLDSFHYNDHGKLVVKDGLGHEVLHLSDHGIHLAHAEGWVLGVLGTAVDAGLGLVGLGALCQALGRKPRPHYYV